MPSYAFTVTVCPPSTKSVPILVWVPATSLEAQSVAGVQSAPEWSPPPKHVYAADAFVGNNNNIRNTPNTIGANNLTLGTSVNLIILSTFKNNKDASPVYNHIY
jgi:hypothetical protein